MTIAVRIEDLLCFDSLNPPEGGLFLPFGEVRWGQKVINVHFLSYQNF